VPSLGWLARGAAALLTALALSPVFSPTPAPLTLLLPPLSGGCAAAPAPPDRPTAVALTVSGGPAAAAAMVPVCLDGHGPYPFLVDSGAGATVVDAQVASAAGLGPGAAPLPLNGVGCHQSSSRLAVGSWSLEGVALRPQLVLVAALPGFGLTTAPAGILGADVLSRFGAVRLDFARGRLVVPGPEGPPGRPATVRGPVGPPPPADLLVGPPRAVVPATVTRTRAAATMTVGVRLGRRGPYPFTVDTGAEQPLVDRALAARLALAPAHLVQVTTSACARAVTPFVASGPWAVGRQALPGQPLLASTLDGSPGLLGANVLVGFGSVVLDFAGARLVLGAG
jgi:hypothetical protein